uniref:Variant surface glycoprotein n=1 Tax=Trypanosoma brucei TaxID=5691 RepID=A0A1V0FZM9_9TRYP|nr:variant surface glycoprotein [Trypanosoma brucei]
MLATLGAIPDTTLATEPTKAANADIYRTLCTAVNALDNAETPEATVTVDSDSRRTANLLKLFLRDGSTMTLLADSADPKETLTKAEGKLKELCENGKHGDCADAADYLKSRKGSDGEKLIKALTSRSSVLSQINTTVDKLSEALSAADTQPAGASKATAATLLKTAVLGDYATPTAVRLAGVGSDRQGKCGTSETRPGTAAGSTIAGDLLCICGSNLANGNKGCLLAGAGQVTYAGEVANQGTVYEALAAGCKNFNPKGNFIDASQLRAAATKIMHKINEGHGNDGKISYLGKSDSGNPAAGCTGEDDAGGTGACVIYGKDASKPKEPGWMAALLQAAAAL